MSGKHGPSGFRNSWHEEFRAYEDMCPGYAQSKVAATDLMILEALAARGFGQLGQQVGQQPTETLHQTAGDNPAPITQPG